AARADTHCARPRAAPLGGGATPGAQPARAPDEGGDAGDLDGGRDARLRDRLARIEEHEPLERVVIARRQRRLQDELRHGSLTSRRKSAPPRLDRRQHSIFRERGKRDSNSPATRPRLPALPARRGPSVDPVQALRTEWAVGGSQLAVRSAVRSWRFAVGGSAQLKLRPTAALR